MSRNCRLTFLPPLFQGGSDIIRRSCPVMPGSGDRRPKSQRHQKEFNLEKGDLPNVNCHLTPPTLPTTTVPLGSCSRSRVERELNQGFSCYKRPSAPVSKQQQQQQTEAKDKEMGLVLCSHES